MAEIAHDDGSSTESEYYEELDDAEPQSSAPEPVSGTQNELFVSVLPSSELLGVDDNLNNAVAPVARPDSRTGTRSEATEDAAGSSSNAAEMTLVPVVEAQPTHLSTDGKCIACTATLPEQISDMAVYHRCKCCKLLYPPRSFVKGHCTGCLMFARWLCSVCGREGLSAQDFTRTQRKQKVRSCKQCIQNRTKLAASVKAAKTENREESAIKKLKREVVELKVAHRAMKKRNPNAFAPEDAARFADLKRELNAKTNLLFQHKRKCAEIRLKANKKAKRSKSDNQD